MRPPATNMTSTHERCLHCLDTIQLNVPIFYHDIDGDIVWNLKDCQVG